MSDINVENKRVDVFLHEMILEKGIKTFSRTFLKDNWGELIEVNGSFPKPSYKLRDADDVKIDWKKVESLKQVIIDADRIEAEDGNLDILYEDGDILILDKPKGVPVHPGVGNPNGTLANIVKGYLEEKDEYDPLLKRAGIVHRLDKSVGGLIIFAKRVVVQQELQKQFEEHTVRKIYLAEVVSKNVGEELKRYFPEKELDVDEEIANLEERDFVLGDDWYRVEGYIGRSGVNRIKMEFKRYQEGNSKYALSFVKPVSSTKVLVIIKTGRMHQIRASLSYFGMHIEGDTLYQSSTGGRTPETIALRSIFLAFNDMEGEYFSISKV